MQIPTNDEISDLVSLACLAPSVHNTQPWHWTYRDGVLTLFADTRRQLMYADGNRRDLVMSCGAALHELDVAARAAGWATSITRLPDPSDEARLATITFAPHSIEQDDVLLAGTLPRRRTDRRKVSSWPVPVARVNVLCDLAASRGVLANPVDRGMQQVLWALLSAATHTQNSQVRYLDELLAWTSGGDHGIPATSLLTTQKAAEGAEPFTRFPAGSLEDAYNETAPPAAAWLLLSTSSDDTLSWLRTGEALSSIWLSCTLAGLSLVPYTQPVEVESTRAALQTNLLDGTSCPQVLLRIGWPAAEHHPVPPTSRRPVSEVLEQPEQVSRKEER